MALWKLHGDGSLKLGEVVAPHERLSWGKTIGLGAQHVVAMFGATFVFPLLMGLNPQLAVMMSGIATLVFLLVVKGKVPSYLGSSASFVGVATAIYSAGGNPSDLTGAMFWVGVLLLIVGLIISAVGAKVIHRALPPVVTGGVVMLIGFNLAPVVANTYWPQDQWVALVTMLLVVVLSVGGEGLHRTHRDLRVVDLRLRPELAAGRADRPHHRLLILGRRGDHPPAGRLVRRRRRRVARAAPGHEPVHLAMARRHQRRRLPPAALQHGLRADRPCRSSSR
jgi:hypothetical protein